MDTDEMPPELDEPQPVPLDDPEPGFTDDGYRDLDRPPTVGYGSDWVDPYHELGGLGRPDAYYGAREFDCPNCKAPKGEKCVQYLEHQKRWAPRHMPCKDRIKVATKAGLL